MTESRVSEAYARAKAEGRAALVGYLPAGFPTGEGSIEAIKVMAESGCDVIEIGLPYSDPVMDGPTIQAAAQQALDALALEVALGTGRQHRQQVVDLEDVARLGQHLVVGTTQCLVLGESQPLGVEPAAQAGHVAGHALDRTAPPRILNIIQRPNTLTPSTTS